MLLGHNIAKFFTLEALPLISSLRVTGFLFIYTFMKTYKHWRTLCRLLLKTVNHEDDILFTLIIIHQLSCHFTLIFKGSMDQARKDEELTGSVSMSYL